MSKKKKNTHSHTLTLLDKNVPFQVTEAFKTLRTNLIFALSQKSSKIIAISSALASEGKSTTAANIAITLAQANEKVLLIDADLRKPVQHKVFKLKNKYGLSTLLSGLHSFKEVLNEDIIPGLDIVTCGPIPPNPSEMLGSENMKVLLEELSKYYDYIVIDTPPINIVTDTLTLLKYIAGVVLVAMQGVTNFDALEQAIQAVNVADDAVLGVVLTNVDTNMGKYNHKYKYSSDYSYGENANAQPLEP
ncbi:MAG: CpsD/CapB family tyrosine-protein kinase [Ruminococcus sp.]|nr:CpsD/CapB family tyrosine-protein kinase [Ruminococcus sp.]